MGELGDEVVEGRVGPGPEIPDLAPTPAALSEKDHQPAPVGLGHREEGVVRDDAADALEQQGGVSGAPRRFTEGGDERWDLGEHGLESVIGLEVGKRRVHRAAGVRGQPRSGRLDVHPDAQSGEGGEVGFGVHDEAKGPSVLAGGLEQVPAVPVAGIEPEEEQAVPRPLVEGAVDQVGHGVLHDLVIGVG